jgi:hypothetical protein
LRQESWVHTLAVIPKSDHYLVRLMGWEIIGFPAGRNLRENLLPAAFSYMVNRRPEKESEPFLQLSLHDHREGGDTWLLYLEPQ